MSQPIGNLGTIPLITIGGAVFTDLTNLIVATAHIVTAARYTTYRKVDASAGYQVTAAKTWRIDAFMLNNPVPGGTANSQLLYGDTDVGLDSASAPTTPKYSGNDSGFITVKSSWGTSGSTMTSPIVPISCNPLFKVPAAKYAAFKSDGGVTGSTVFGYET